MFSSVVLLNVDYKDTTYDDGQWKSTFNIVVRIDVMDKIVSNFVVEFMQHYVSNQC